MKISYWLAIKRYCVRLVHLQLFLSLFSLPFLISWGLPFSLLSPLGNLLFGPILTLFLFICSLIFFLELFYLPNAWLIWLLEKVTTIWLLFFSHEQKAWLIGFAKPPFIIVILITGLTFLIMQCRYTCTAQRAIPLFALLFIGTGITLKIMSSAQATIETIERMQGQITIINKDKQIIVIDPGYIGRNSSAASWVTYTLIPEITKRTGTLTIDHLIVLQPNNLTFQALAVLCTKMTVNTLYLPWWTGTVSMAAWRSFVQLRQTVTETNTKLLRIKDHLVTIDAENLSIIIEPLEEQLSYQNALYPALCVYGQIDNKPFKIYAAKHKKIKKKETYE